MTEPEVVEEMEYLICRYMNCGLKVAIMGLIGRRYRHGTIRRLNKCYRAYGTRLAEAYGIPFVKTTKFRFRRDISVDSLHLKPESIRQLARDFGTAFGKL